MLPQLKRGLTVLALFAGLASALSSNATADEQGCRRQLKVQGKPTDSEQLNDAVRFLLAKTKHVTIHNGSTVDGSRLHRAYAAAMRYAMRESTSVEKRFCKR
jgi:hypothetical protein